MTRPSTVLPLTIASALLLASCGGSDAGTTGEGTQLHVVTAFYPLEFATQQVVEGVDGVEVETLTSPGVDAHDLELTPRQVGSISEADLVVYSSGMQAAVDEAVGEQAADHSLDTTTVVNLVDRSSEEQGASEDGHEASHEGHEEHEDEDSDHEGHENEGAHEGHEEHDDEDSDHEGHEDDGAGHEGHDHGPLDPHFWLDPQRYADATEAIAEELAIADPANAEAYRANAQAFAAELGALDTEFSQALATCEQDTMVTTHEAFGYLADRYGLHQIGISGIVPDGEVSPARVAEITRTVEELGVPAIYAESSAGGDLADVIASETGTQVLSLDPIEGISGDSAGSDYLEVMSANLEALRQGQGCA
ncbi:metal ABC transporter substrate-binding protein [Ornithinimicrobium murale]|uniref:metal ABC transporter substrate-binding protein n=1 Tax=Ornithinimicrobium murale TaxID=1050153 RepID=UPI000E0DEA5A|nr:metal ABC transporter substrate-binding protein [Ornithinimicrobium murale]